MQNSLHSIIHAEFENSINATINNLNTEKAALSPQIPIILILKILKSWQKVKKWCRRPG